MSFMERVERRWERRQASNGFLPEQRDIIVQGEVVIAAHRQTVWQFLLAPEATMVTSKDVTQVFRIPGTPIGVKGEQRVHIHDREGLLEPHVHEAVVVEPPTALVEVCRTMPWMAWTEIVLTDAPAGTRLRTREGLKTVSADRQVAMDAPAAVETELKTRQQEWLTRTKRAIEAGVQFPAPSS